jgi:hypothetical protein
MNLRGLAASGLCLLLARPAFADGPIGPNGSPITTSDYSVDLTRGVTRGNARIKGMGGAYVGVGEGVAGNVITPVAPAMRGGWSISDFNYDLGFFATFPGGVVGKDWFNTGQPTNPGPDRTGFLGFTFLTLTNNFRFGKWGVGLTLDLQTYGLAKNEDQASLGGELTSRFQTAHLIVARNIGDFVLGAGLRIADQDIRVGTSTIASSGSGSVEAGALWKPHNLPLRVGASFYSAALSDRPLAGDNRLYNSTGDLVLPGAPGQPDHPDSIYLPSRVELPFELSFGMSYQLGPRPYNFVWKNPKEELGPIRQQIRARQKARAEELKRARQLAAAAGLDPKTATRYLEEQHAVQTRFEEEALEREKKRIKRAARARWTELERFYVLLSTQMTLIGAVPNAVGVESFVAQVVNRSGQNASLSFHLGAETEILQNWVKVRAGTYLEPTRFRTPEAHARIHGTAGLEVKVLRWRVFGIWPEGTTWRASGFVDGAERYLTWGVAVGNWW